MPSVELLVVGVDGSAQSRFAVEYAVREAAMRGSELRAVSAFESSGIFGARYGLPIPVSDQEIAKKVEEEARRLVDDVLEEQSSSLHVTVKARAGSAGWVLVDASREADLLIVGHRGRGGVVSTLLGSVGLYCVLYAPCPVIIARPRPGQILDH